jgi:hypothetical protein
MTEEQTVENTENTDELDNAGGQTSEASASLAQLLSEFPDSPSNVKIDQWKQRHGEIFCSGFSEEELIVWRPINRKEFVALQEHVQASNQPVINFELEEQVVQKCLLWSSPKAETSLEHKAGSLTTLNEQIMQNSNFINPQMAAALCVKL